MNRVFIHKQIHYLLLIGITFTIPFPLKINSLLIVLCALNRIIEGRLMEKVKNTFSEKINIFWIVFFVLHVLSYFMSSNQHEAGAILERRLSMLAFPLLVFDSVNPTQAKNILFAFVTGVFASLLLCYANAFMHYFTDHHANVFFYHDLTSIVNINAVYMAAYVVFCIHILLHYSTGFNRAQKIWMRFLVSFFIVSCFMLSSKMMLFVLVLGLLFKVFGLQGIKHKVKTTGVSLGIIFILLAGIFIIPNIRDRFTSEFTSDFNVLRDDQMAYNTHFTGTSLRLRIWKFCFEIMDDKNAWLTGTGTGDFQDLLNERYRAIGMYTGNPVLHDKGYIDYGPHNQYIETMICFGIPVLMFFLFLLTSLWRFALKSNHYLLIQLLLSITLFCATESVISTNKGIVFFMFFACLLTGKGGLSNGSKN